MGNGTNMNISLSMHWRTRSTTHRQRGTIFWDLGLETNWIRRSSARVGLGVPWAVPDKTPVQAMVGKGGRTEKKVALICSTLPIMW